MIHALIPSIVSDQLAPKHNFLRLRLWHWKHRLARLHCQTTRKKRQNWCDLRDRTAERNAETLVRVRSISPEAGGFRTKYIWKCGSFGKGSTRREDMDELNVVAHSSAVSGRRAVPKR
jgi:hypothetical protein